MEKSVAALKMTLHDSKRVCQESTSCVQLNRLSIEVCMAKELRGITNLLSPDLPRQQTIEKWCNVLFTLA
jgi:hypothetical protein